LQTARELLGKRVYDLVILDLMLPDGSGEDLISEIYKMDIPVIVYTAYELGQQYQSKVNQVLIKSKTSNKKILDAVKSLTQKIYS